MHKLLQTLLIASTLSCLPAALTSAVAADEAVSQKAALVTGASSGIGRRVTEVLAAHSHFGTPARASAEDIAELVRLDGVEGVRLDVTVQAHIDAAVARIAEAGRGCTASSTTRASSWSRS